MNSHQTAFVGGAVFGGVGCGYQGAKQTLAAAESHASFLPQIFPSKHEAGEVVSPRSELGMLPRMNGSSRLGAHSWNPGPALEACAQSCGKLQGTGRTSGFSEHFQGMMYTDDGLGKDALMDELTPRREARKALRLERRREFGERRKAFLAAERSNRAVRKEADD